MLIVTGKSFSGREFDMMSEDEQREACRKARLFSRVEPAHKSKIVEYLQKEGAVSAMVSEIGLSACIPMLVCRAGVPKTYKIFSSLLKSLPTSANNKS